ncbi:hypothetical protein N5E15_21995 [Pantoea stewartii]|uniref:hypothetical protein n=1 Tax=Pantoea stewartii TaxID=66269 RepID=UPI0021D4FE02|nr:hypothetical protein [Pantoea stewartii]MCU7369251.1 hypothetical protein [Pantoea stewartii]
MAPSLIGLDNRFDPEGEEPEDYDKPLEKIPKHSSFVQVGEFFHVSNAGNLYRLREFTFLGAEYPYYIFGDLLESCDPVYQLKEFKRLRKAGEPPPSIAKEIEALKLHVGQPETPVFRAAYCDFGFVNKSGAHSVCKQIRGVYVHFDYQAEGLSRTVYDYLIDKYSYLACDYTQTILGATLWAISVRKIALVEIYDTSADKFIEELGDNAVGVNGYVPWDIGRLPKYRINEWFSANFSALNMTPGSCQHIINIASRPSSTVI